MKKFEQFELYGMPVIIRSIIFCFAIQNIKFKMWITLILSVVLYVCVKTWFFLLREGYRLRVFENRVLRNIVLSERDEVASNGRKLRFNFSPHQVVSGLLNK